ncbi:OmpA family protein [Prevotella sp. KH2C16]|uniref:OmpA family protein n=1 Tax=Prevotella sp. KH2C16 TaxID=1855325 RepID=UPI0008EE9C3D|nr:OmpA family protein [Prevotella sp. KH2C16]SFG12409.1 Outer membrane protein OmpA [Prevotella sp. KH2C16]
MRKLKLMTLGLAFLTVMSGVSSCATKQGTGTLAGAGGGAVLGGILGNIIGKDSKATAIGAAIGGALGAGAGTLIGRHMDKVAQETAAQVQNAKVEEVTDVNGLAAVKVTFDSGILFATNKAALNAKSKNDLAKFAGVLKNNTDCHVDIYGHTDSTGNDGINLPLSNSRAQSVVTYLKSCGVPSSQFKNIEGKGSSEPVADNSTSAGRQQNRRVEVYMYASPAMVEAANAGTLK